MRTPSWSLQDAKNKFSEVVKAARAGRPQLVTRRGIPAAVVISIEAFQQQQNLLEKQLPSLTGHLLAMPSDNAEFERLNVQPRDIF
jgi:antitoxin Phd